ncbi:hypothetical protein WNY63_14095 [Pseudoalteromonas neustonica]|uniref:Big-1 domain-containing protein n=1 Tax=Pseudoalteromonas neustonica TaxID=1840331 RepID=A0ABU9U517_9GAMM
MPLMRWLSVVLFSFLITACGGGGSLEKDGGDLGGGGTTPDTPTYTVTVQGFNQATNEQSNSVTKDAPLFLRATVLKDGEVVTGKRVTFSLADGIGSLKPTSGSALTDGDGVAQLALESGSVVGAGQVTATYLVDGESYQGLFAFTSSGGQDTNEEGDFTLTLQGYSQANSQASNIVTSSASLDLRATLQKDGVPVAGKRITFTLADNIGLLEPSSGSALTQNDGIATIELTAGKDAGAGKVTATYTISDDVFTGIFEFQSTGGQGDDTGISGDTTIEVKVLDENGVKFSEANPVTNDNVGTVTATLKKDGVALSDQLVTFSTNFTGQITPDLGTSITNVAGEAKISLGSGNFKGAGEVIAKYNDNGTVLSKNAVFYSSGDSAPVEQIQYTVSVRLLTGCNSTWDDGRDSVKLDPTQASSGCSVTNNLSSSELGEILVEVIDKQNGDGVKNALVNLDTSLGSILPSSGTALTDNFGMALLKLQPGNTGGAGTITARSLGISSSINFAVGIADLILEVNNGLNIDALGNVIPLKAGGSTIIEVTLRDEDGNLYLTPTDVEFSSTCVTSGSSVIDAVVKSSSGIATSTYRANGCGINDDINITVETGGKNFTATTIIPVETSDVQSIQFIDVSETFIALPPGEGGQPTQSVVRFKLLDADNIASSQQRIDFKLTDTLGFANLTLKSANTDNDGFVQTTVTSGIVPGPLVVKACYVSKDDVKALPVGDDLTCWVDDYELCQLEPTNEICPDGELHLVPLSEQISSVSSQLTLSSGVADQNSFDASPVMFNPNSLYYNGITTDVTVFFGDQFNNYNGDGVEATILAEAGVIGSASNEETCKTTDAMCVVTWRSQGDRPFWSYKWGNRIGEIDGNSATEEGINPKTKEVNCDPYFGIAAPCINGIKRAKNDPDGVVMGGRVSILAVTKGQENFVDEESTPDVSRRNGLFDIGEYYKSYDLAEAFMDHNENSSFDKANCSDDRGDSYDPVTDLCSELNSRGGHNETWRDLNSNGLFDGPDGKYNGLLCSEAANNAGECSRELIEVRKQFELVMSGDTPYVRFSVLKGNSLHIPANCVSSAVATLEMSDVTERCDVETIDLSIISQPNPDFDPNDPDETDPETIDVGLTGISIRIHYTDEFGNPLPAGTEVTLSTTNGDLSIIGHSETILSTNTDKPLYSDVRIAREAEGNKKLDGILTIKFAFENQFGVKKVTEKAIAIFDDK